MDSICFSFIVLKIIFTFRNSGSCKEDALKYHKQKSETSECIQRVSLKDIDFSGAKNEIVIEFEEEEQWIKHEFDDEEQLIKHQFEEEELLIKLEHEDTSEQQM